MKGSGRSIPAYSMAKKLHDVEDLLIRYGGHPMAAGLSLPKDNIESFRKRLNENAGLSDKDLVPVLWIDAAMPLGYITKELVRQLELLKPFGEGNERPLFAAKDIVPYSARYIGKERQYLKLELPGGAGRRIDAVYFRDAKGWIESLGEKYGENEVASMFSGRPSAVRLDFTYYPSINTYMGREYLQVKIEDYRV